MDVPLLPIAERGGSLPRNTKRWSQVPLEDELFMSPWEKWRVYRHPPLKMIAHLLLVLVATPTLMFAETEKVSFLRDLRVELVKLYYPERCRPECLNSAADGGSRYCEMPPPCSFMLIDDVTEFVRTVVRNYYTSKESVVSRIDYLVPPDFQHHREPVHMRVHFRPRRANAPPIPEIEGAQKYELRHRHGEDALTMLGPLGGLPALNITQRTVFDALSSIDLFLHFKSTEYDELYGGRQREYNVLYPPGPIAWSFRLTLTPSPGRQLLELRTRLRVEVVGQATLGWREKVLHLAFGSWALIALLSVTCIVLVARSVLLTVSRLRLLIEAAAQPAAHEADEERGGSLASSPTAPFASPLCSPLSPPASMLATAGRARTSIDMSSDADAARALLSKVTAQPLQRMYSRSRSCARIDPRECELSVAAPDGAGSTGSLVASTTALRSPLAPPCARGAAPAPILASQLPASSSYHLADAVANASVAHAEAGAAWRSRSWLQRLFTLLSVHTLLLGGGACCLLAASVWHLRGQLRWTDEIDIVHIGWPSNASAIGIGCVWVSLTRYFEWAPALYTFTHTLRRAAKNSVLLMAAVAPVFLAYALAGTILFSDSMGNFSGFSTSCVTLWAMCLGDEVNENFRQVYAARPIVGRVYTYSFTAIFYFTCANIFVFLIEAAHYAALRDIFSASGSSWAQRLLNRRGGKEDEARGAEGGFGTTAPHAELPHHRLFQQTISAGTGGRSAAARGLADDFAPPLPATSSVETLARMEAMILRQQRMLDELLQAQQSGGRR